MTVLSRGPGVVARLVSSISWRLKRRAKSTPSTLAGSAYSLVLERKVSAAYAGVVVKAFSSGAPAAAATNPARRVRRPARDDVMTIP